MSHQGFTWPYLHTHPAQVMESQGHIRDLATKAGSVNTADNFKMTWHIEEHAQVRVDRMKHELQQDGITRLVLATDPDREGEAIAWHLQDVLQVHHCLQVCSPLSWAP